MVASATRIEAATRELAPLAFTCSPYRLRARARWLPSASKHSASGPESAAPTSTSDIQRSRLTCRGAASLLAPSTAAQSQFERIALMCVDQLLAMKLMADQAVGPCAGIRDDRKTIARSCP